jgi:hypothetical protein
MGHASHGRASHRRVSHRRVSHERASLVGLSRGPLSRASFASMHLPPAQSLCPLPPPQKPVLCLRPRPRASVPCLCPYSCLRASALQAHTVYPGPLRCFSRTQPAEALQGWKGVDSYSLISRAAWIQLYKKRQNSAKISANNCCSRLLPPKCPAYCTPRRAGAGHLVVICERGDGPENSLSYTLQLGQSLLGSAHLERHVFS